jgi:hypothetical protein
MLNVIFGSQQMLLASITIMLGVVDFLSADDAFEFLMTISSAVVHQYQGGICNV